MLMEGCDAGVTAAPLTTSTSPAGSWSGGNKAQETPSPSQICSVTGVRSWRARYKTTELSVEEVIAGDLHAGGIREGWPWHSEQARCRQACDGKNPASFS